MGYGLSLMHIPRICRSLLNFRARSLWLFLFVFCSLILDGSVSIVFLESSLSQIPGIGINREEQSGNYPCGHTVHCNKNKIQERSNKVFRKEKRGALLLPTHYYFKNTA
jgi:hypothetical protein